MTINQLLEKKLTEAIHELYAHDVQAGQLQIQPTKKEFTGDFTLIVFPLTRLSKKKPEETGEELGRWLKENVLEIKDFNVIKGFLNLSLDSTLWLSLFNEDLVLPHFGVKETDANSPLVMVEFSSPNTNKPLHLGHVRNNLLGSSLCRILEANGNRVFKTNIVNDRGIHICKSMLAWKKWGEGETPASTGKKGDHLVGEYYVAFDKHFKQEVAELMETRKLTKEEAEAQSSLMAEARDMLLRWEAADPEVKQLWSTMNDWVYTGFDETYRKLGVSFDKIYYESQTYLPGKDKVLEGLEKGLFYRKEDGSVWADLTNEGLDQKVLLRGDGTSVYMTQDIGTATLRFAEFPIDKMVYVVGNEQNYHFQVLSFLLDKLGFTWGKDLVHFSYGMVELPEGKMKSREGTVVDADELVEEMITTARETSRELGKLEGLSTEEAESIAGMVGLGALKYFILKVDPRKNMTFNPKESIDFNGNTGPFIQYTHARICSILRKAEATGLVVPQQSPTSVVLSDKELYLIRILHTFPETVSEAAESFSPAIIANYLYDLAKEYNQFYHDYSILKEANDSLRGARLLLSSLTAHVIKTGMSMLGIDVPERM